MLTLALFSRSVSSEKRGLPACWGVEWGGQKEIMEQQPTPQQLTTKKPSSSPGTKLCVTALSWTHTAEVSGSLTAFWSLLPAFAIKIILRRQPSVFAWLPLLFFFLFLFLSWWVILPAYTLSSDKPDDEVTGVAWEQNWPHYPQPLHLHCHW